MRLRIDPTHAEGFAHAIAELASNHQAGEFVEITACEPGSGLVKLTLRPLDPDASPRMVRHVFGSLRV